MGFKIGPGRVPKRLQKGPQNGGQKQAFSIGFKAKMAKSRAKGRKAQVKTRERMQDIARARQSICSCAYLLQTCPGSPDADFGQIVH